MKLNQSVRYALGIFAICFLFNGISSAADSVQEQTSVASKTSIEPEGKIIIKAIKLHTLATSNWFQLTSVFLGSN